MSSSLIKFEKLIEFIEEQNLWYDFIDQGKLNINKLSIESSIARSVFYHNKKVSLRREKLINELLERGIVSPVSSKDVNPNKDSDKHPKRDKTGREVSRLKEELRKLQNQHATLKAQLDDERAKNHQLLLQQSALSLGRYRR